MTSDTAEASAFKVFMHPDLVDALDYNFSPGDGISAIEHVFGDLPNVHRSREGKNRKPRKTLRLYTGRLAWYPLGFSYVQIGKAMHVLKLWEDDTLGEPGGTEVDSVVGTN